ncbi:ABC transporter ATP-binding protein [Candidatus Saccharibacteria bacterium]|nr:ABC transporter ATP-binding protein [Candidatus Saccharibacteria bacterium]
MFKLFRFLKPYWWQVLLLFVTTGAQVYCILRLPTLMASIINEGIVVQNTDFIWQQGLIMLGLAAFSAVCALFTSMLSARIGANFSRDLRAAVFAKVISFNHSDTKDFSTASLITRTTNDINQVQQTVTMILSMLLRAPLFCIISLIMAFRTAPDMTWIIAVAIITLFLLVVLIMALVIPKFKVFQKLIDKVTLLTRENLTGLRVIRAFNNQKIEYNKFNDTNKKLTKLLIFIDKILELQDPLINIVFNGTTLLCVWIGISLLEKDFAYLGNMTAFAEYVTHVMISILMLSILLIMLPRANVSAGRINEVLKAKNRIRWHKKTDGKPSDTPEVEFKNVDFKYDDAEEKILSNISFTAKAGETTAFIGSTGSGKSTLINLVPRFYEATSGEILIDGINIKNYSQEDLISHIGFVPQRGVLFSGTIKSNIAFGRPDATEEEIIEAAKISQSQEFIEKLPKKYDAPISQGGTNVSGGQKQRLSIARAICKKPEIFVFDDSFSALDMKTDQKLRKALQPIVKNSVTMIVAQRINTIKDADQIIVLDKGKIVGKGTHYKLLRDCEVYTEIVKSQLHETEFEKEMKEAYARTA